MRKTKRLVRILGGLALASLTFTGGMEGWSQQSPINPLDALRTMSQSDRDSLMKNFGIDPSAMRRDSGTRMDSTRTNGSTTQSAPMQAQPDPKQLERERTYLQPGDTLVIQVDFHLDPLTPPETLETATAAAQAAAAGAIRPDQLQQLPPGAVAGAQQQQQQPQGQPQAKGQGIDAEDLPADVRDHLQKLIDLIRSRNPYQLSRDGTLLLPGFPGMPLSGLTEQQATLRLQADPSFAQLQVRVLRLPLEKQGPEGLQPFGYDLFNESPSTFAPFTDVPVPADYVLGPGDELNVQLYGNDNRTLSLMVDREGAIDFPQIGPLRIGGQRFNDAKQSIESRVRQQMIGVQANVSMGDTRSIQVFVLGEARKPGAYTISGLGTVTSALYASGGLREIGSLRHIQVKRQGRVIRELDLYDLLLRGDTKDDTKLLPGDVIFVPPVGPVAAIYGEVHRPAIYELRSENTVAQLIALAGGLTSEAQLSRAVLTQIDAQQRRVATNIDLTQSAGGPLLRNGDILRIDRLRATLDSGVTVGGHVFTPGTVAYREGLRLSSVISSVDELRPNADIHYLLVRRELPPNRRIAVISADLAAALAAPGSDADISLQPRDQITVFDLESGRDRIIAPLMNELRLQSGLANPTETVRIDGRAKVPGEYPLEPGMTVSDLIRAGGGLQDAAYGGRAELSRYNVVNGESRRTELLSIDLAAVLRGDAGQDIVLQPFDDLSIKEVQDWGGQEQITLVGEIRFPGKYTIKRGETLKSVLARAGGLNEQAFADGAVFTRTELKDREQKQLDVLAGRLQNDLATLALQGAAANQANAAQAFTVGQSLLSQLKGAKATGRLVIDLSRTMRANQGSQSDLILRDGDTLIVPRRPQEVTVIGEVQSPTSHLYREELSRADYIALSGGETRKADKGSVYVVRADGSVVAHGNRRWFNGGSVAMKPGDTVVVPLDTERLPALPFWQAVTQILYNLSISAAAVNSF